jgi:thiamine pyrophosphate-dependent acetolactate synthase large subunit-like protein
VYAPAASPEAILAAVAEIERSDRPAILVGRGATSSGARDHLETLGQTIGAVMGTTALAKGFFGGGPFEVGVVGGYSTEIARKLMRQADLVLAFGASLNHRTTDAGATLDPAARIIQVDLDASVFGARTPVELGIVSNAEMAARALNEELSRRRYANQGFRTPEIAAEIAANSWHALPLPDTADGKRIDPRVLSVALNRLLPANRTVVLDSGVFQTYPFVYLDAPDPEGFVFVHSFMAIGFGLGNAVGAAVARPDRLTVAAVGDGGALMAMPELETMVRYSLPILVVVYNDAAYGAEAERCRLFGEPTDLVTYPETDFAALAGALGFQSAVVRSESDLEAIRPWATKPDGPFLIDAKIDADVWAGWFGDRFQESWKAEVQP